MKTFLLLIPALLLSIAGKAQADQPTDFYGTLTIEDNKTIDFDYLVNPGFGTTIAWFDHIPGAAEYTRDLQTHLLPFSNIRKIEFMEFTNEESRRLERSCPSCTLRKAKIVPSGPVQDFTNPVFLVLRQVEWKSSAMKDLKGVRSIEARFLEEISLNFRPK